MNYAFFHWHAPTPSVVLVYHIWCHKEKTPRHADFFHNHLHKFHLTHLSCFQTCTVHTYSWSHRYQDGVIPRTVTTTTCDTESRWQIIVWLGEWLTSFTHYDMSLVSISCFSEWEIPRSGVDLGRDMNTITMRTCDLNCSTSWYRLKEKKMYF